MKCAAPILKNEAPQVGHNKTTASPEKENAQSKRPDILCFNAETVRLASQPHILTTTITLNRLAKRSYESLLDYY
jgi:hypothetical protein